MLRLMKHYLPFSTVLNFYRGRNTSCTFFFFFLQKHIYHQIWDDVVKGIVLHFEKDIYLLSFRDFRKIDATRI